MDQNSTKFSFPKYIVGFSLVCFLLFTPLALKIYRGSLEPYPAIILPSGEWTVKREGNLSHYNAIELLAAKITSDSLEPIPLKDFLQPLPPHLIAPLANREFGLKNAEHDKSVEVDAIKRWLRVRLDSLGYISDSLTIRKVDITINVETKEVTDRNIAYGKTLALH